MHVSACQRVNMNMHSPHKDKPSLGGMRGEEENCVRVGTKLGLPMMMMMMIPGTNSHSIVSYHYARSQIESD